MENSYYLADCIQTSTTDELRAILQPMSPLSSVEGGLEEICAGESYVYDLKLTLGYKAVGINEVEINYYLQNARRAILQKIYQQPILDLVMLQGELSVISTYEASKRLEDIISKMRGF